MSLEPKIKSYQKGAAVIVQGQPNQGFFYIVRSGSLAIDSEHRLEEKALSVFDPGDSFGLVSALTSHQFLVTVYATVDSEVLRIPVTQLGEYLKHQPELAYRIMSLYARELRALQKHLASANVPSERGFFPERLVSQSRVYLEWKKPRLASYALRRFLRWVRESGGQAEYAESVKQAEELLRQVGTAYEGPIWESHARKLPADEVLFLENEPGEEIYIVSSGRVKLFNIVRGHEYVLDIMDEGEIFGEMALLEKSVRMASAITETPAEIMRLAPGDLMTAVGARVLQKVFESLARRIWFSHQRLIILRIKEPITRLYALLYNMLRDQDIKRRNKIDDSYRQEHIVKTGLTDLKTMSGILRIRDDAIKSFLTDPNLEIGANQITVRSRQRLEEKLVFYKTRSGQIAAELV
ncbi:MAG: cyclic nucleotide-binding domain-containing protein [Spirochaetales bacterium]|nr:cyclic nucleotide-binding domain-containing protein [Spirochaetales bacterium]